MLEFVSVLPSTGDGSWLGTIEPDRRPSFSLLSDAALATERAGFGVCLVTTGHTNNHFADQAGYVDSIVTASALIPVTRQLRLLVAIRPGWVDAAACARMGATMDQFSSGRFMINVVAGGAPALMYGEELDNADRHQRASEFTQVLHALWTQQEANFEGRYFALREASCWPKPCQQPRPPIYVAGSSTGTLDMAARWADCLLVPGMPLDQATQLAHAARQRAAGYGRELQLGIYFYVTVRMTTERALDAASAQVGHIEDAVRHRLGGQPEAQGHEPGTVYWMGMRRVWRNASVALVGSYDDVARTLTKYANSGFTTFVISAYPACAEIKRFGAEIIPRLIR